MRKGCFPDFGPAVGKKTGWEDRVRAAGAATVLVEFHSYEGRQPCGSLLSLGYDRAFNFQGLDQMLLIMDDIMDAARYPQSAYSHRYLGDGSYVFQELSGEEDAGESGNRLRGSAALSLRVYFRQYGSMQGELIVPGREKREKVLFRSALELMRLIHEYLDAEMRAGRL